MQTKRFLPGIILALLTATAPPVAQAQIARYDTESAWLAQVSSPQLIDFEGFVGTITNQYPGLTFSGINGGDPITTNGFAFQGNQSILVAPGGGFGGGGGGFAVDFTSPQSAVAIHSADIQFEGSQIRLFSGNTLLDTFDLLLTGAGHGGLAWGFNGYVSSQADITRVEIQVNDSDAVLFDNFQFATIAGSAAAPEPGTLVLLSSLAIPGFALALRRRRS